MKLLIELPTWLGDTVMTTPALENLFKAYPTAEVTLLGSYVSTEALKSHPRIQQVWVDTTKSGGFRPWRVYQLAKKVGPHDLAISFRSHFYSKLLLKLTGSKKSYLYNKKALPKTPSTTHQVQKYQAFINHVTGKSDEPEKLTLPWSIKTFEKATLGINPGATYGSAKRWYPEKFAEVATALADRFNIIIFGGPSEKDIAGDIESMVRQKGIKNVTNLAGKTTIPELCSTIGGLDLFITGDSGPMHIAAAYQIPTVAIFGPTKHQETCQWMNPKSLIVRHDLECAPCMKRTCPIKTHACMKEISPQEVLDAVHAIMRPKREVKDGISTRL